MRKSQSATPPRHYSRELLGHGQATLSVFAAGIQKLDGIAGSASLRIDVGLPRRCDQDAQPIGRGEAAFAGADANAVILVSGGQVGENHAFPRIAGLLRSGSFALGDLDLRAG